MMGGYYARHDGEPEAIDRPVKTYSSGELAALADKLETLIGMFGIGNLPTGVDAQLLVEPAEQALHAALQEIAPQADALFEAGDYTASLQTLAALREPVDAFFNEVMVNAEDPSLKANRLGLLHALHQAMNRVADLSRLAS